jgi:hypothetical protein
MNLFTVLLSSMYTGTFLLLLVKRRTNVRKKSKKVSTVRPFFKLRRLFGLTNL